MNNRVSFSRQTCHWATDSGVFNTLNTEFRFTLDVCAAPENAKCKDFFTPEDDGLLQNWSGVAWCNPPYGPGISKWIEKAFRESHNGVTSVLLLPSRTDTRWFHSFVLGKAEIRFIKGRLKFGAAIYNAPFPSMIVIYRANGRT